MYRCIPRASPNETRTSHYDSLTGRVVLEIEGESLAQLLRRQAGGRGMRLSALGHRGFHCHLKLRALLGRQLRKVRVGHRQSPHGLNGHRGLPEAWFHVGSNICRMHREKGQRAAATPSRTLRLANIGDSPLWPAVSTRPAGCGANEHAAFPCRRLLGAPQHGAAAGLQEGGYADEAESRTKSSDLERLQDCRAIGGSPSSARIPSDCRGVGAVVSGGDVAAESFAGE